MQLTFFRRALVAALALGALATAATAQDIDHAQPTLKTERLEIVTHTGVHRFEVEIAVTPRQQEVGLMYRPAMAPNHGMLFEMGPPQQADFWMKHCPAPLDMLFIRADGRILTIAANTTPYSTTPIDSGGPITGVLELRGGRAAQIAAAPGDVVRHPYFHDE